jgi:hypothetical protein
MSRNTINASMSASIIAISENVAYINNEENNEI